jgi:hypothetical protein
MMNGLAPCGSSFCWASLFSSKFRVRFAERTMPGLQTTTQNQWCLEKQMKKFRSTVHCTGVEFDP